MANRKPNGGASERTDPRAKSQRELEQPKLPTKSSSGKQGQVTVTFEVTVPEETARLSRSVFLAGTLHQINSKIADWDTRAQPMKKVDNRHWTISLAGPENAVIEYKYCLGDWDHVERDTHQHDIGNRRVTLTRPAAEHLTIHDTVKTWRS